jgi:hypothetical protein
MHQGRTMSSCMSRSRRFTLSSLLASALVLGLPAFATAGSGDAQQQQEQDEETSGSQPTEPATDDADLVLSDEVIPMLLEQDLPRRSAPLIELGPPLLGPGKLGRGWSLPTGAVWTPSLWIFGTYRTSISYVDSETPDSDALVEWPHRLDVLANLQLSGTERLVLGLQPLHHDGKFTTYTFTPSDRSGWGSEVSSEVSALFFEGDIGEIFPGLEPMDDRGLDIGFAVGRQLIEIQDGIMINDTIDSIGITRNTVRIPGTSSARVTALVGWNEINRDDNVRDDSALLYGLFTEMDTRYSTIEIDAAFVDSGSGSRHGSGAGDGLYWGLGTTQRVGFINTTLRLNGSHALDEESAAVSDGTLLFAELSTSPRGSHDVVYLDLFWGIDRYSSAARAPTAGGPLGRTGLLFAAVGLGRFRPALGNRADEAAGAAVGYQRFWDHNRTQLVVELGGRQSTEDGPEALALGARLQRKLGRRLLLQLDGYVSEPDPGSTFWGLRSELLVRF